MVDFIIFNKFLFVSLNFEEKLMIQKLARSIPCTMFHVTLSLGLWTITIIKMNMRGVRHSYLLKFVEFVSNFIIIKKIFNSQATNEFNVDLN